MNKRKPDLLWILAFLFGLGSLPPVMRRVCWSERWTSPTRPPSSKRHSSAEVIARSIARQVPVAVRDRALQRYIPTSLCQTLDLLAFMRHAQQQRFLPGLAPALIGQAAVINPPPMPKRPPTSSNPTNGSRIKSSAQIGRCRLRSITGSGMRKRLRLSTSPWS